MGSMVGMVVVKGHAGHGWVVNAADPSHRWTNTCNN